MTTPAEDLIPSFADEPDSLFGPASAELEESGESEEETTQTQKRAAKADKEAKSDDEKPPAPGDRDAGFFERLAAFDQHKREEAEAREAERKQAEEAQRRWNETLTAPPLPEGEEREKLTLEGDAIAEVLKANQEWVRKGLMTLANAISHVRGEQEHRARAAVAEATAVVGRALDVSASVGAALSEEGWDGVHEAMAEADQLLQSQPNQYLDYRLSPQHFEQAVRYVLHNRVKSSSGAPPARSPKSAVAPRPELPYTRSTPASVSQPTTPGATPTRSELARAARAFGLRNGISQETLKKTGRVVL